MRRTVKVGPTTVARPETPDEPVGSGSYEVRNGDCISSIAYRKGHFWETVWNHGDNDALREVRKDPNALLAGDRLTIPELRHRDEDLPTGREHTFRLRGVPAKFRMRFLFMGEPRSNEPYRIEIDGVDSEGRLDNDGVLEASIIPTARMARITFGTEEDDDVEEHVFNLGGLDPVSTVTGLQQRLNALGFGCPISGRVDDDTAEALCQFQHLNDLEPSGERDARTLDLLLERFGS